MNVELGWAAKLAVWVLPVLFAVTLHEVAHGLMAKKLGDDTASKRGRLSLNPLRHVDPLGTIVVPGLLFVLGGFVFGWAKPVPVVVSRLNNPKRDMAIVAIAGPLANLAMALVWALVTRLALIYHVDQGSSILGDSLLFLVFMGTAGILINVVLLVLNMMPLPPLDGGRVLVGMLPLGPARLLARVEPYGLIIIMVLLATENLGKILSPILILVSSLIVELVGIPANVFIAIIDFISPK